MYSTLRLSFINAVNFITFGWKLFPSQRFKHLNSMVSIMFLNRQMLGQVMSLKLSQLTVSNIWCIMPSHMYVLPQNLNSSQVKFFNNLIIMFNFNTISAEQPSVDLYRFYHRVLWTGFRPSGTFFHRLNANHKS